MRSEVSEHGGLFDPLADAIIAKLRHPIVHITVDSEGELDTELLSVEEFVTLVYEEEYNGVGLEEDGADEEAADAWQETLDHIEEMIYGGSTVMPDDDDWINSFWALRRDELVAWYSKQAGGDR
jgi:hypothetical protein